VKSFQARKNRSVLDVWNQRYEKATTFENERGFPQAKSWGDQVCRLRAKRKGVGYFGAGNRKGKPPGW